MTTRRARTTGQYVGRRTLEAVGVVILAYLFSFVVLTALPGDPISAELESPDVSYTPDQIHALLHYYGLDRSVWVQLWESIRHLLHGQLGYSLQTSRPVGWTIRHALPSTLGLAGLALAIALVAALVLALGVHFLRPALGGSVLRFVPSFCLSLPYFFVALMIMQIFSFKLGWFNVITDTGLKADIMPAVTLAIPTTAPLAQVLISSLDRVRGQGFITVTHARGFSEWSIFSRHMLRPASLPVLTLLGLSVGELLSGSVITEAIFARQGLGALISTSVSSQDVPVLQGVVIMIVLVYSAINLLVDLAYPLLDPRVRSFAVGQAGVGDE